MLGIRICPARSRLGAARDQQQPNHKRLFAPARGAVSSQGSLNGQGSTSSSNGSRPSSYQAAVPKGTTPATAPSHNTGQQASQYEDKRAVVVGGGWAGFGAALALAKAGAKVTLLDASANPGGLSSAFTTSKGQLVEPGIKGFWYQYANIEALVAELGIPSPFTPFTKSSFWSPCGLQVESPIFQDLPRLPAPLGSFVHTAMLFRSLPLPDRATAVTLLKPLLEHDLDKDIYRHYDSMSAYELFQSAGVSRQLYDKLLAPMLLVTLFAPATELSAAAALGALYYFALAHTADFDVRWARGPIGELIFTPLVQKLKSLGVNIIGGRRAEQILPISSSQSNSRQGNILDNCGRPGVVVARGPDGQQERHEADVIVLAAGVPALQKLVMASPVLAAAEDLRAVMAVRCSDVLAVRLWLSERLQLRMPSNVVAGFDDGVGGTFFQLEALQDMYRDAPGSVIEFDLYHAEPLLPLSDEALIHRLLHTYLPPALGDTSGAGSSSSSSGVTAGLRVLDSSVLRFRNAVTQFSPGSNDCLPGIATSLANVFVAGDCVKQGPGTHGCKGLSQEKAYVSGLQAGNAAASRLGLAPSARVIPVEPDEPHITAAKDLLKAQRALQQLLRGGLPLSSSSRQAASARPRPAAGDGSRQAAAAAAAAASGAPQVQPLAAAAVSDSGGSDAVSSSGSRAWSPEVMTVVGPAREDCSQEILAQVEDLRQLLRTEVVEQVAEQDHQ